MSRALLVGDIGGTSVRFGLIKSGASPTEISDFQKRPGDDFQTFEDALAAYIADTGLTPDHAVFGVAGPVENGQVTLVNRPDWPTIDEQALATRFGFSSIRIVNDFAAMARSVPELTGKHFTTLFEGVAAAEAPVLVAGAGTGFGVATIIPEANGAWSCVSGEGGHARYAPQTEIERQLAAYLQARHGYVSNELICGGTNLALVHAALCEIEGQPYEAMPHEAILAHAEEDDPICRMLCEIRAAGIMATIGDLALINGTLGGVFLAGGVSQRLQPYLTRQHIGERFFERGPRSEYVRHIPVHLIQSELAPLIGAGALYFQEAGLSA